MERSDNRVLTDRRNQPTPALSRYTLWGRRESFRRVNEGQQGGYVDRYSPRLFFALILIAVLSVSDSLITILILSKGGEEVNPIVRSAIELYGDGFWIWKFVITSACLVLLCLHSQFRRVRAIHIAIALSTIYLIVVLYEIQLISYP